MRVLVVGVGFMGTLHARAVRDSRMATLCGVVDRDERVAGTVATELDVPARTDLSTAIEDLAPDAVVVATPDPFHREPVTIALSAGLPVLVEKPLATTIDDAEAMAALAEECGTRLMTGHLTRFHPRYVQVAELVGSGGLGRPVMVTTSTWGQRSLGARVSNTTNPLWHFAIHDIDLVQWITGGLVEQIDGAQLVESSGGIGAFAATGGLSTGGSFHMSTGWTLPDTAAARWDLKVHCEGGVAQATWSTDGVTVYTPDAAREVDCLAWPSSYGQVQGALRLELDHFLAALLDETPFAISPQEAVAAVRSATALEKASVRRRVG